VKSEAQKEAFAHAVALEQGATAATSSPYSYLVKLRMKGGM